MNGTQSALTLEVERRGTLLIAVESCVFLLLAISACIGNIFVMVAVCRNKALRTVTNMYIVSLALTDFLMAVMVISVGAIVSIANRPVFGQFGCQLYHSVSYCLGGISLLNLGLLAVNRYVRVVKPALYPKVFTKRKTLLMIICVWLVTIFVDATFFTISGMNFTPFPQNPTLCFLSYVSKSISTASNMIHGFYVLFPSLVIFVCYAKVFRTVKEHNRMVAPSLREASSTHAHGVEEAKMTKLLAVMLVGFYLCWLPLFITRVLQVFNVIAVEALIYYNFYFYFPAYASSVINPIIYTTMSQQFRKEFRKIIRAQFCPEPSELLSSVSNQVFTLRSRQSFIASPLTKVAVIELNERPKKMLLENWN